MKRKFEQRIKVIEDYLIKVSPRLSRELERNIQIGDCVQDFIFKPFDEKTADIQESEVKEFKNINKLNPKQLEQIQNWIDDMIEESERARLINKFKLKSHGKLYPYNADGYSECAINVIDVIRNYKLIYEICKEIAEESEVTDEIQTKHN